jgi:hypothetical protein
LDVEESRTVQRNEEMLNSRSDRLRIPKNIAPEIKGMRRTLPRIVEGFLERFVSGTCGLDGSGREGVNEYLRV